MQQFGSGFNRSEQYLPWPAGSDLPNTAHIVVGLFCCKDTLLECVSLGFCLVSCLQSCLPNSCPQYISLTFSEMCKVLLSLLNFS